MRNMILRLGKWLFPDAASRKWQTIVPIAVIVILLLADLVAGFLLPAQYFLVSDCIFILVGVTLSIFASTVGRWWYALWMRIYKDPSTLKWLSWGIWSPRSNIWGLRIIGISLTVVNSYWLFLQLSGRWP